MAHFNNLYRHGFARVAAFAPAVQLANPKANAEEMLRLLKEAHADGAVLAVFPELSISGYSVDDLHHQDGLLDGVAQACRELVDASAGLRPVFVFGAALRSGDQLFNCSLVAQNGTLLGVIPKTYLPNYREFYEKRWFADSRSALTESIDVAGLTVPFGTQLLFEATDLPGFVLFPEICEDFWAPVPPSTFAALAGATVLVNLSASNATIGKSRERDALIDAHSRRTMSAYVFTAAGVGESTTDLAWDGQLLVYENGDKLADSGRFFTASNGLTTDVDLDRIKADRLRLSTWRDSIAQHIDTVKAFRRISFTLDLPLDQEITCRRKIDRFPFVPDDLERLDEDCFEAYNIQVQGLRQRMQATGLKRAVIGVSGGLDSTQALIVAARAFDKGGLDRKDILAVTLPGFATSKETRDNALDLIKGLGVTHREIDIRPASEHMLSDLGHPYAEGESAFDVTFENVQAGLRTDYLFRMANHEGGLVIGTGDLSELALGWCTYGVGDQMSHYNVNAGVAKTLIQHLIAWAARREEYGPDVSKTLRAILGTEISPELIPAGESGSIQSTQQVIGPYPLQDFTLHYVVRYGFSPERIAYLQRLAWGQSEAGDWPDHVFEADRRAYSMEDILHWLEVFARRFYGQSQFKRSAMPNGPKLTSAGALSPRGDWRMPSDSSAKVWLDAIERLRLELDL